MDFEENSSSIEKIIEGKIEERFEKERRKRKKLEKKIERLEAEKNTPGKRKFSSEKETSGVSRRGFLKGLGALGIGALAVASPVSGSMKVTSESIEKDGQNIWQGGLFNTNNYLDLQGNKIMAGNLNLGANSIENVGTVDGVDVSGHVNSTSNPHGVDVSQIDTYSTSESDSNFASSGHTHNQLHDKYTDSEARSAVDNSQVSVGYADSAGNADTVNGKNVGEITNYTESDSLSDVERYTVTEVSGSSTVLLDVSGTGILMNAVALAYNSDSIGRKGVEMTVDGNTVSWDYFANNNGDQGAMTTTPSVKFNDSLKIEIFEHNNNNMNGQAWIKWL